ncbi:hypothetical protein BDU57DRAFT_577441 [Ampelomyces quisqualis]|uniref:Uncharacterized protein n=1 Tax=Ampelomyces quisqualis TaxID=50730 RepID=A0A6A5QLC6_AMPQU|nr:hypothetical protein BDU57DRAFT_577441 [Ampelomyces quisqualis]
MSDPSRKQSKAVRLVLRLPGTSKSIPTNTPPVTMDSTAPLISQSTSPMTILEMLKKILDEDEPLSENLPDNLVHEIDVKDTPAQHGSQRIRFGRIEKSSGANTEIYAYMSTSSRQRDIPEIHFYSRQPYGSLKRCRLEDVIMKGELDDELLALKGASSPAILVLLQCLFIFEGIALPLESAISARFIFDARNICYRFKNYREKQMNDHARRHKHSHDEAITSLGGAPSTPAPQPDEGIDAGNTETMTNPLATTTARKRSHSSVCNQSSMVDGNSNGMRQAMSSASLDPHYEYAKFTSLHEQKCNSKTEISDVNDSVARLLRGQHDQETKALVAAHKAETKQALEALKEKQDAELQAQTKRHASEAAVQWQEPAEGNTGFFEKLSALTEEKNAKVEYLAQLEAKIELQRKVLQSLPNVWEAIEGEIEGNIRKRMRIQVGEEDAANGEE